MPENKRVGVLVGREQAKFNDWNALVGSPLRAECLFEPGRVPVDDRVF